jgi:Chlororespiratory reduction 6
MSELDPHNALRKKFHEIMSDPKMLWGIEVEPYDLLEKDTRLPLASINLANEEGMIEESCGRFRITLKGYDDDPRQVFDIPEVRGWFTQLAKDAPHFPFFIEPEMMLVYAAAVVSHTYEDGAIHFDRAEIADFISGTQNAVEIFCAQAKVDPAMAVGTLLEVFDARPHMVLPMEIFALPEQALLFAIDLDEASALFGENFWRSIDGACLGGLQLMRQRGTSGGVSIWCHLSDGLLGLFLAGADAQQADSFTQSLSLRFGSVMSPPEALAPTRQALPFWALREDRLLRCAEDDPEEGPAVMVAMFDGEEWAFEAYEPEDELLGELLELTPGIEMVVARVID